MDPNKKLLETVCPDLGKFRQFCKNVGQYFSSFFGMWRSFETWRQSGHTDSKPYFYGNMLFNNSFLS